MKVGCGCVNLGSASSRLSNTEQVRLIRRAFDSGVTVFDTADIYGGGASEQLLGEALGPRRSQVTISTKGGYVFRDRSRLEQQLRRRAAQLKRMRPAGQRGGNPQGASATGANNSSSYQSQDFSPDSLRRAIQRSLTRLDTDHIDVFQLHGPRETLPGLFVELDDLRRDGLVGRWGVGSESHESARSWCNDESVEVIQVAYGLLDTAAREQVLPLAAQGSIDVWARGVLGGGILNIAMSDPDSLANHPKRAVISDLLEVATQAGLEPDELAIRWMTATQSVSTMLLGMSSEAHLDRNVALAQSPQLPADVVVAIENAIAGDTAQ